MTTITQGLTQDRWTYYLNVENQPIRQRLQVVKVDAESGETITMDHAHFKIYDRQTQRYVTMECQKI
ncbi:hypothetical protein [Allofustis seminis]|uniref:hypothetical protein n=1 Tax=Allofustis seminis TaxID=166939 RepID=UPI00036E8CE9|nr:hypothetical protein [Allofustis seminis]